MHFAHLPALRGVWKCGLQALQTHTSWPTTKSENTPTPNRSLNRHESQTNRFRSSIWEQVATASSGRYVTVYQLIALLGYKGWENRVMAGTSLEPLTPISSSGWQAPDWTGRFIEGHSNTSTGQTCSRYMQWCCDLSNFWRHFVLAANASAHTIFYSIVPRLKALQHVPPKTHPAPRWHRISLWKSTTGEYGMRSDCK